MKLSTAACAAALLGLLVSACAPHTTEGRFALGGAGVIVAGAGVATMHEYREPEGGDGADFGAIPRAGGMVLAVTGAVMLLAAIGASQHDESKMPDAEVCIEWQRAIMAAGDLRERASLERERPAHCSMPPPS